MRPFARSVRCAVCGMRLIFIAYLQSESVPKPGRPEIERGVISGLHTRFVPDLLVDFARNSCRWLTGVTGRLGGGCPLFLYLYLCKASLSLACSITWHGVAAAGRRCRTCGFAGLAGLIKGFASCDLYNEQGMTLPDTIQIQIQICIRYRYNTDTEHRSVAAGCCREQVHGPGATTATTGTIYNNNNTISISIHIIVKNQLDAAPEPFPPAISNPHTAQAARHPGRISGLQEYQARNGGAGVN